MNQPPNETIDKLEQDTLAAFAAWRKDRQTKIEILYEDNWCPVDAGVNWHRELHYRIAPTLRPWTVDEMRGKWIREIATGNEFLISGIVCGMAVIWNDLKYSGGDLFGPFTQLDGSPCGVLEEANMDFIAASRLGWPKTAEALAVAVEAFGRLEHMCSGSPVQLSTIHNALSKITEILK